MERTSQKQLFQCQHIAWPIYLQKKHLGEVSLLLKTRIFMKKSTGRGVYEFEGRLVKECNGSATQTWHAGLAFLLIRYVSLLTKSGLTKGRMSVKVTVLLSFTCNFFAYFKFHSYWRRVIIICKIKQNELDCRDTAPLSSFTKFSCRAMFDNTWMTEFIHEQQGFIHTMPDSSCVDANIIPGRVSFHTKERWFRRYFCNGAKLRRTDLEPRSSHIG